MKLEEYVAKVHTGADMEDLGIKPKTISDTLALITRKRLVALRDQALSQITDDMCGTWLDALEPTEMLEVGKEVVDERTIMEYARPGMKIEVRREEYQGMKGTIRKVNRENNLLEVELKKSIEGGTNLDGLCADGHGWRSYARDFTLKVPRGRVPVSFGLVADAVADKQRGHWAKFREDYNGAMFDPDGYNIDQATIPKDVPFRLLGYDEENGRLVISTEENVQGHGNRKNFSISVKDAYDNLQVSSLGQDLPSSKEELVWKKTMIDFFPKVILQPDKAEKVIRQLIMGTDFGLYGQAGSGKTLLAKDVALSISSLMGPLFKVKGCDSNCNPYSLFDVDFAEVIKPCPKCMKKYDGFQRDKKIKELTDQGMSFEEADSQVPKYEDTGIFNMPNSEDVMVDVVKVGMGYGVERLNGNIEVRKMNLEGYSIPELSADKGTLYLGALAAAQIHMLNGGKDGETDDLVRQTLEKIMGELSHGGKINNPFDPDRLILGKFGATNNGILIADEVEKLRGPSRDCFLQASEEEEIQPEGCRQPAPSNQLIICTANQTEEIENPFNDRFDWHAIRYPTDVDIAHEVTRRAVHGKRVDLYEVDIGDVHLENGGTVEDVIVPLPIEKAMDSLYIKFGLEYEGPGKNLISDSVRSKKGAHRSGRAQWEMDNLFWSETPAFPDQKYVVEGMQHAFCSRIQVNARQKDQEAKEHVNSWVEEKFPEYLKEEENKFWCDVRRHIGTAERSIGGIEDAFNEEIALYRKDARNAEQVYEKIEYAYNHPTDDNANQALLEFPFMDYLFQEQDNIHNVDAKQLVGVMEYFLESRMRFMKAEQEK